MCCEYVCLCVLCVCGLVVYVFGVRVSMWFVCVVVCACVVCVCGVYVCYLVCVLCVWGEVGRAAVPGGSVQDEAQ